MTDPAQEAAGASGAVPTGKTADGNAAALNGVVEGRIIVGQVSGLFGTRGWMKIFSYTRPRTNIASFDLWYLQRAGEWRAFRPAEARAQGSGVIARLEGVDDRDAAAAYVRSVIAVERTQLPALPAGEFYWSELLGLRVENLAGESLGVVSTLLENGAHDVLEVVGDTTRLIPYVRGVYVVDIDPAAGLLRVDWHRDD